MLTVQVGGRTYRRGRAGASVTVCVASAISADRGTYAYSGERGLPAFAKTRCTHGRARPHTPEIPAGHKCRPLSLLRITCALSGGSPIDCGNLLILPEGHKPSLLPIYMPTRIWLVNDVQPVDAISRLDRPADPAAQRTEHLVNNRSHAAHHDREQRQHQGPAAAQGMP